MVSVLCGLALGALIVTNTWDFPTYTLLTMLCLFSPHAWRAHLVKKQLDNKRGARGQSSGRASAKPRSLVPQQDERVLTRPIAFLLWVMGVAVVVGLALMGASPFLLRLHTEASRPQFLAQPASPSLPWLLLWGPIVSAWILTMSVEAKKRQLAEPTQSRD